jgi:hypothetical protein
MNVGHGAGDDVGGGIEAGVVVGFDVEPLDDLEAFRGRTGEDRRTNVLARPQLGRADAGLERYPEVSALGLDSGLVLDGELVALDERVRPDFALLQQRMHITTPSRAW